MEFPREAWCDHTIDFDTGIRENGWRIEQRGKVYCTCGWKFIGSWLPDYYSYHEMMEPVVAAAAKHTSHWQMMNEKLIKFLDKAAS